jgi:hypothetical protein
MGFDITDQILICYWMSLMCCLTCNTFNSKWHTSGFCNVILLIRFSAFVRYWRKMGIQWDSASALYRLQEGLKEVLYNILLEFGVHMKLVRLIQRCLNETYSKVNITEILYDSSRHSSCCETGVSWSKRRCQTDDTESTVQWCPKRPLPTPCQCAGRGRCLAPNWLQPRPDAKPPCGRFPHYHTVQNLLSSCLLSKNVKIRVWKTIILPVVLHWMWNLVFDIKGGT